MSETPSEKMKAQGKQNKKININIKNQRRGRYGDKIESRVSVT